MPAIPPHSTPTVDTPWDAGTNVGRIANDAGEAVFRRMYAFVSADGDPNTKAAYSLPHHMVGENGRPGAANVSACRNAMARMMQMQPPLSARDQAGVRAHLQGHIDAFNASRPGATVPESDEPSLPRDDLFRDIVDHVELRRTEGGEMPILVGTLVPYNEWTEIRSIYEGRFLERFAPGSLTKTFQERASKMRCLFEHGKDPQIGNKVLGKIIGLEDGDDEARYTVRLFDTDYVGQLLPGLEAEQYGSSVRFRIMKEDVVQRPVRSAHNPSALPERTVREAFVREFGPCTFPAYEGATAGLRMRSSTDEAIVDRFGIVVPRVGYLENTVAAGSAGMTIAVAPSTVVIDFDELEQRAVEEHERSYRRITSYIAETPWLITEDGMALILSILDERLKGKRLTEAELEERVGSGDDEPANYVEDGIAVIPVMGPILPHASMMGKISGATTVDGIREQVRAAMDSSEVKAILMEFDSPGGSAQGIPELATELRSLRGRKPMFGHVDGMAASAAYFLASQLDEVHSSLSGLTGSIGVIAAHKDISGAEEKAGIKTTYITAGKFKDEGRPGIPLSEEAKGAIQEIVDWHYKMFTEGVAAGRGVPLDTVLEDYGQGRVLTAEKAAEVGMIDSIATFEDTLARLKERVAESTSTDIGAEDSHSEDTPDSGAEAEPHSAEEVAEKVAVDGAGAEAEPHSKAEGGESIRPKEDIVLIEERAARMKDIKRRMTELDQEYAGEVMPEDVRSEFDSLDTEYKDHQLAIADDRERKARILALGDDPERTEPGDSRPEPTQFRRSSGYEGFQTRDSRLPTDIYDLSEYRTRSNRPEELTRLYRDGAREAIARAVFPDEGRYGLTREQIQGHIERLLMHSDDENGEIARRIIATSGPIYRRAFGKAVAGMPLTSEEARAISTGPGSSGGLAVPVALDPTVLPTSDSSVNPLRAIARVETITSNEWKGVSSAGITAGYSGESEEVADDTPTLVQPSVIPERATAFIPFSIESDQDWTALQAEMAVLFRNAKDDLEADKFFTGAGHGSKEPEGLLTGATIHVTSDGSNTFASKDVYALEEALGARFRSRARFVGSKFIFNKARQLDSGGGADLWVRLDAATPPTLIGYPAHESSALDGSLEDWAAPLVFGDFTYFLIVDRIGMNVELVNHLFGQNQRPTGERGLLAIWRNSSVVLSDRAFRVLRMKS